MSLPAAARHRWGLDEGGRVGFLDIGGAVLLVPGGVESMRGEILGLVGESEWEAARAGFGDPDLASE
ncbi:hypothetical protein [Candidatus Poriferisodalis sp.]|uniref:hypothetical protein n=1 Tax=Candidatus Poriferisodalis sp. TaxID=3101277 RepID=UPI003B5A48BD